MARSPLTARGYVAWCLGGIAALAIASAALCWYADPYAIFRDAGLRGERFVMRHPRMVKPHMLERAQPSTLMLGSSRIEQGLNPYHPSLDRAFNAALPGATLYEVRRLFDHGITVAPVRRVIIELALFQFGTFLPQFHTGFSEERLAISPLGHAQTWYRWADLDTALWSLETLESSLHCANPFGVRRLPLNRIYPAGGNDPELILRRILAKRTNRMSFDMNAAEFARGTYRTFTITDPTGAIPGLAELEHIATRCAERSIQLQIFVSPEHDRQTVLTRLAGLADSWDGLRRMVVERVLIANPQAQVWDFSCAPSWTDEPIPPATQVARIMQWYNDGGHYTRALGDAVLERLSGAGNPAFGERLDHADLSVVFARQRAAIARWEQTQPDEYAAITAIWTNPNPPPMDD